LVIVIDASVAVKLYREEEHSDLALSLFGDHAGDIIVPDIFAIEVASAIVREANILKDEATEIGQRLVSFAELLDSSTLQMSRLPPDDIPKVAQLAIDLGHPLKDCIYLALAMELGSDLITADVRFAVKAAGVWNRVRVLGE
jgi:predicted nucleic acid-binding protein